MRTSSIRHPKFSRFIKIYDWQLEACEGNACAAALLSLFESWYNHRLAQVEVAQHENRIAEANGLSARKNAESLVLFLTDEQLVEGIMHLYKRDTIRAALAYLERRKFVSVTSNPNPRFKFDRTRHFHFHAREVNKWLDEYVRQTEENYRASKTRTSATENQQRDAGKPQSSPENQQSSSSSRRSINRNSSKDSRESKDDSREARVGKKLKTFIPDEVKTLTDELRAIALDEWGRAAKFLSVEQEHTKFVADAESKSLKYVNWSAAWRKRCVLALQYATRDGLIKLDEVEGGRVLSIRERRASGGGSKQ